MGKGGRARCTIASVVRVATSALAFAATLAVVSFATFACRRSTPTIGGDPTPQTHDAAPPAPPPKPELPPGWDANEMSLDPPSPRRVSLVLAYRSLVDDRPLYFDEAIVWVHDLGDDAGAEGWRMVHVYRHPKDADDDWKLSIIYDADDYAPSDSYDHAPTIADAEKFFDETWWWDRDDGFKSLAAGMPRASWRSAFHADPIVEPPKDAKP
jgi:hypothetical protein